MSNERASSRNRSSWLPAITSLCAAVRPTRTRNRFTSCSALWEANLTTALFFGWYHISNEQLFAATVPGIVSLRTVLIILPVSLACH